MTIRQVHISAGGNRHPEAADWQGDLLAFGSGRNVALWQPDTDRRRGIQALLRGHSDVVQAVRMLKVPSATHPIILSGSADKTIRVWHRLEADGEYRQIDQVAHDGSVNTISVLQGSHVFISGAADGTIRVWRIADPLPERGNEDAPVANGHTAEVKSAIQSEQTIVLKPRVLPLTTALTRLGDGSLVFAVAGTASIIQMFVQQNAGLFELNATLSGHEGWIRALAFVEESTQPDSDLLLASASQDRYVRLWRLHRGGGLPQLSTASQDPSLGAVGRLLSNKPHYIGKDSSLHSVTFEALLIGHEDWIYTAKWHLDDRGPGLLTTSADNSVSVWRRQADSGFWICETRLGEISAQKGSTTATGSVGGFWIGLWSPRGDGIASLGRTGSWKLWQLKPDSSSWVQQIGISGHVKDVKDLAWASDGSYLLSTGSDQTTRLLAPWNTKTGQTWHEMARPQIHGYDISCIDTLGPRRFISGADEKLLRVFNEPKATAMLLSRLTGKEDATLELLPDTANMPVLGLSNKAATDGDTEDQPFHKGGIEDEEASDSPAAPDQEDSLNVTNQPPLEDLLSRQTLWPELEKLYGHGYEISAVAASHDGKLVATACRASSVDHAVIRLYETSEWREIKPPLSNHSLTVTSLAFSPTDDKLLSVGRDRQWSVFEREAPQSTQYSLRHSNPKGHSRMILDCAWLPMTTTDAFATAGRDKSIRVWRKGPGDADYSCAATIPAASPVTAIAIIGGQRPEGCARLAWGSEEGGVSVARIAPSDLAVVGEEEVVPAHLRPAGAVNALSWRPRSGDDGLMLAMASEDHTVRLYSVEGPSE